MNKIIKRRMVSLTLCVATLFLLVSCNKKDDDVITPKDLPTLTTEATLGGVVSIPSTFEMPTEAGKLAVGFTGTEMFGGFNHITSRGTEYFTNSGSITITMTGSLKKYVKEDEYIDVKIEKEMQNVAVALFKKDGTNAQFITTAPMPADGATYQATFSGLDPTAEYRFMFAYTDYPRVRASAKFTVSGVTTAPAPVVDDDSDSSASKK